MRKTFILVLLAGLIAGCQSERQNHDDLVISRSIALDVQRTPDASMFHKYENELIYLIKKNDLDAIKAGALCLPSIMTSDCWCFTGRAFDSNSVLAASLYNVDQDLKFLEYLSPTDQRKVIGYFKAMNLIDFDDRADEFMKSHPSP